MKKKKSVGIPSKKRSSKDAAIIVELKADNRALQERKEYYRESMYRTEANYGLGVAVLLLLLCASLVAIAFWPGVDEDAFCANKLLTYFPEHEYAKIYYEGGYCKGKIYDGSAPEVRDGLKEIKQEQTRIVRYELINKEDRDFVKSDDWRVIPLIFAVVAFFSALFFLSESIERRGRGGS